LPRADPDDVGGVAAAGPLGVKGVDGATADCPESFFQQRPLRLRVSEWMQTLNIELVGPLLNSSRWRLGGGCPVFVDFEGAGRRLESALSRAAGGAWRCPLRRSPGFTARTFGRLQHGGPMWKFAGVAGWWRCWPVGRARLPPPSRVRDPGSQGGFRSCCGR